MDVEQFCRVFPRLYHMAHQDALPSILRHGLLSTSALLDLYEVDENRRRRIEGQMRRESVKIEHRLHGQAVIRDQMPIGNDERLRKSLTDGATPRQFHRLLNSMVFFWVNPARLNGLRNARAYRGDPQLVITLDTRAVVECNAANVRLCPMNSGACMPIAHPRSMAMFKTIGDYDFEYWRKKKGSRAKGVVEFTLKKGLSDPGRFILKTEILGSR